MYALVHIKGKQYRAEKGSLIRVDKLAEKVGTSLKFDSVLLVNSGKDVKCGSPYVEGARVSAKIVEHVKDKKVVVFKYRRRKDSMSKNGHRQQYSVLKITALEV